MYEVSSSIPCVNIHWHWVVTRGQTIGNSCKDLFLSFKYLVETKHLSLKFSFALDRNSQNKVPHVEHIFLRLQLK